MTLHVMDIETCEPIVWRYRNESATVLDGLVAPRLMTDERLVGLHQSLARQGVNAGELR